MIGRMMALALGLALAGCGARAATVEVPGGALWYEICGTGGAAIVLVHDGVLDSASFDGVWARLCKDHRVLRYVRRGFGLSPAAKAPYAPEDDLAAVIQAAGFDRFSLVGFSAGGGIAANYALDHSDRVQRLILSGPAIDGFRFSPQFARRNRRLFLPMLLGGVPGVMKAAAKDPYLLAPGHEAAAARATAIVLAHPSDVSHNLHDPVKPGPSALPRLPGLTVPTLVLTGDHDHPDLHAAAGMLEALIPGTRRVIVDDAGHFMQLEHPDEVAGLIARFVEAGR
jgi:pimeloyl-ACP methyl ester carboxylesterase